MTTYIKKGRKKCLRRIRFLYLLHFVYSEHLITLTFCCQVYFRIFLSFFIWADGYAHYLTATAHAVQHSRSCNIDHLLFIDVTGVRQSLYLSNTNNCFIEISYAFCLHVLFYQTIMVLSTTIFEITDYFSWSSQIRPLLRQTQSRRLL